MTCQPIDRAINFLVFMSAKKTKIEFLEARPWSRDLHDQFEVRLAKRCNFNAFGLRPPYWKNDQNRLIVRTSMFRTIEIRRENGSIALVLYSLNFEIKTREKRRDRMVTPG